MGLDLTTKNVSWRINYNWYMIFRETLWHTFLKQENKLENYKWFWWVFIFDEKLIKNEPLMVLINHSDNEGNIKKTNCLLLVPRLEEAKNFYEECFRNWIKYEPYYMPNYMMIQKLELFIALTKDVVKNGWKLLYS